MHPQRLLGLSLVTSAAVSASMGCVAGVGDAPDGSADDDVGILSSNTITGEMEYDVAVFVRSSCLTENRRCDGGPVAISARSPDPRDDVYAHGFFIHDGDYFFVGDMSFDSHSVGLNWEDAEANRQGICRLTLGAEQEGSCNKNLPEHDTIRYRVGRCDGDKNDCTSWQSYVDVSGWSYTTNDN